MWSRSNLINMFKVTPPQCMIFALNQAQENAKIEINQRRILHIVTRAYPSQQSQRRCFNVETTLKNRKTADVETTLRKGFI